MRGANRWLCCLALLVTACGGSADDDVRARTVVWPIVADLETPVPLLAAHGVDQQFARRIQVPLFDQEPPCRVDATPRLALGWDRSADGREILMALDPEAQFEDGHPITAEDAVLAWELLADPDVASIWRPAVEQMEPPEAVDAHTIRWRFSEAYDPIRQLQDIDRVGIVPAHVFQQADRLALRGHPSVREPLAAGPWRVADRDPGQRWVLERNPAWWGETPEFERVVLRVIPDQSSRMVALLAGELDGMGWIRRTDLETVQARDDLVVRVAPWSTFSRLSFNTDRHPVDDVRVRRALAQAIDRDEMVPDKHVEGPDGPQPLTWVATGWIPPICGFESADVLPEHDPAAARATLAEAGWTDTDGDGVVDKDGKPLVIPITVQVTDGTHPVAVRTQADLAEIGIRVEVEALESQQLVDRFYARDYTLAFMGSSLDLPPTFESFPSQVGGDPNPLNHTGYADPQVDTLIHRLSRATTQAERVAAVAGIQERLGRSLPELPLAWGRSAFVVHERFEGVQPADGSRGPRFAAWGLRDSE